jgi:D-lactate dehydrogenase
MKKNKSVIRKIAFFNLEQWQSYYIKDKLNSYKPAIKLKTDFNFGLISEQNCLKYKDCDAIAIFVWSKLTRNIINSLPKLRLILTMSTGYDHIDLDICRKKKITVCNVPNYGENTVAEHTFALILSLSRQLKSAQDWIHRPEKSITELRGFDLYGKTLGVIGAGNIGLHVIRIARGFGMNVLAYDINPQTLLAEVLGFKYTSLNELLKYSDIISLHVPATKQTYHMLDTDEFSMMKKGAILINTARGSVVNTEALLVAIDKGIISGAGLDVIEGEEFIKEESALLNSPVAENTLRNLVQVYTLMRNDKVIFTPHTAFNSYEAVTRILDTTIDNLISFIEGRPINKVI